MSLSTMSVKKTHRNIQLCHSKTSLVTLACKMSIQFLVRQNITDISTVSVKINVMDSNSSI